MEVQLIYQHFQDVEYHNMKILKIKKSPTIEGILEIEVEGYEGREPNVPDTFTVEEIKDYLLNTWKPNQDNVDTINAQSTPTQASSVSQELKDLEGTIIK